MRAGAVIYAGVQAGADTVIGHHTLLRSFVTVGEDTQLGHNLTIERAARIGDGVRCSPGSHITSSCVLADRVFLGAGVRTVNDRELIWRARPAVEPELVPPRFDRGAKVVGRASWLASSSVRSALVGRRIGGHPATFRLARPPTGCPPPRPIRTFSAVTGGAAAWIAPLAAGQPELGELDLGRLAPLRHGTA